MNNKLVNLLLVVSALANYNLNQAMWKVRNMEANLPSHPTKQEEEYASDLQQVKMQLQREQTKRMLESYDDE